MTSPQDLTGYDRPAGFSSPIGSTSGNASSLSRTVSEASALSTAARQIADQFERAAKATASMFRSTGMGSSLTANVGGGLGRGAPVTGSNANGGGARFGTTSVASPLAGGPNFSAGGVPGTAQQRAAHFAAFGPPPAGLNGGGASFGGVPATAGSSGGPGDNNANGGGFSFGAFKKVGAAGLVGAVAGGLSQMTAANFIPPDFVANRLSLYSGNQYSKAAGAGMLKQFGGSFLNNQQMQDVALPLIYRSGFGTASPQFGAAVQGAVSIARANPLLASQAGQIQNSFNNPYLYNNLAMTTGVRTVGRGGAPLSAVQIANQFLDSPNMSGVRRGSGVLSERQLAANFQEGNGGILFQLQQSGMSAGGIQAVQDALAAETSKKRRLTAAEISRGVSGATSTILGSQQQNAAANMDVQAKLIPGFAAGFEGASKVIRDAAEGLAATMGRLQAVTDAAAAAMGGLAALHGNPVSHGAMDGLVEALGLGSLGAAVKPVIRTVGRVLGRAGGGLLRGAGGLLKGVSGLAGGAVNLLGGLAGTATAAGANALFHGSSHGFWSRVLGQGLAGAGGGAAAGALGGAVLGGVTAAPGALIGALGGGISGAIRGAMGDGEGWSGRSRQVSMPSSGYSGMHYAPEIGDGPGTSGRGPMTYKMIESVLKTSGLNYRISSDLRPGPGTSYHSTGNAVDVTGPKPSVDSNELLTINRWLAKKFGKGLAELIYSGPGGISIKDGAPLTYDKSIRDMHHNHVHVAVTQESLKRMGKALPQVPGVGVYTKDVYAQKQVQAYINGAMNASGTKGIGVNKFGQAPNGGWSQAAAIDSFFNSMSSSHGIGMMTMPDPGESHVGGQIPNGGPKGNASGSAGTSVGGAAIDKFLRGIRLHESGGNYRIKNGSSTASGAYQYLDSTWNNYGGFKHASDAPPTLQDQRARLDLSEDYRRLGNWRLVAATHFRGAGWVANHMDPNSWSNSDTTGGSTVPAYVKDVLNLAGLPETGDGLGGGASQPMSPMSSDPMGREMPMAHAGGRGGGNRVSVHSSGGVSIGRVEVHLHNVERVSDNEAKRIGSMVVAQIAHQAKLKEMSR